MDSMTYVHAREEEQHDRMIQDLVVKYKTSEL